MEFILSDILHIQVKMRSVPGSERLGMLVRSFRRRTHSYVPWSLSRGRLRSGISHMNAFLWQGCLAVQPWQYSDRLYGDCVEQVAPLVPRGSPPENGRKQFLFYRDKVTK